MTEEYQLCFDNMHESWEKYTELLNEFMDHLTKVGISKFFAGFCHCPTSDSIRLRHVTAIDKETGDILRPETLRWPFGDNDFERYSLIGRRGHAMQFSISSIFHNNGNFDKLNSYMWVVDSIKRTFEQSADLRITVPTLVDEWGHEYEWNMNEAQ